MNDIGLDMVRIRPTFPVKLGSTAREDDILPYRGWAVFDIVLFNEQVRASRRTRRLALVGFELFTA